MPFVDVLDEQCKWNTESRSQNKKPGSKELEKMTVL